MAGTAYSTEAEAMRRADTGGIGALTMLRRLIEGRLHALRELDDNRLRDIGASSDDIWRVHKLRNGERPTLLVG
jgi:uncharacterized protein YjiS (DUF1127 family)